MKIVKVAWVDSALIHGWRPKGDERDGIPLCETVGFLLERTDAQVVLAMTESSDDNILETIAIPRSSITKIDYLRVR